MLNHLQRSPESSTPLTLKSWPGALVLKNYMRRIPQLSLLILFLCPAAFGIDRDRRIDQLYHTSWTAKDGVPADIRSLAQTTDGYLWIGTPTGLVRFDGVQF